MSTLNFGKDATVLRELLRTVKSAAAVAARGVARGVFPHQLSWLLHNPLRRLMLSPQQLADRLPLRPDSRVLEIGPGSGYFSAELAARVPGGTLQLVDIQPEMLTKARAKLAGAGPHILYVVADAGADLPFGDRQFDIAVLVSVLGEVSTPSACLLSLGQILRSGGLLAVHESFPDPDRIDFDELVPLAARHGFRLLRRHGHQCNYTAVFARA